MVAVTETYPRSVNTFNQKADIQVVPVGAEDNWVDAQDVNEWTGDLLAVARAIRLHADVTALANATVGINGKGFRFTGQDATGLGTISTSLATDLNKAFAAAIEKIEEGGDLDGTASASAFFGVGRGLVSLASGAFPTGTLLAFSAGGGLVTFASGATLPPVALVINATTAYVDVSGRLQVDGTNLMFDANGVLQSAAAAIHAPTHQDGGTDELPVDTLAEAAAPGNDVSQALRPDGSGGVAFSDVAHTDLTGVTTDQHHAKLHAADHPRGGADEIDGDTLDIDFTPANYTPSTAPAEVTNVDELTAHLAGLDNALALKRNFQFFADQMENPVTADWAVNALAPAVADSNNDGIVVRLFDDTTEEGIGFPLFIPTGTVSMKFTFVSRAETAPGAVRTVGLKLYERGFPGAVDAWSAGTVLTDIDIPTSENWLIDTQTITITTLGVTAGQVHQFELTRIDPAGGTELVGDWALFLLQVEFI